MRRGVPWRSATTLRSRRPTPPSPPVPSSRSRSSRSRSSRSPSSLHRKSRKTSAGTDDLSAALLRLDEITRRLRRECPWDREQDERSIVPHTVEEAYELADAAHGGDDAKLLDELGDVLFQVYFLALLLEERGQGDLAAVAEHCRREADPPAPARVRRQGRRDRRGRGAQLDRDQARRKSGPAMSSGTFPTRIRRPFTPRRCSAEPRTPAWTPSAPPSRRSRMLVVCDSILATGDQSFERVGRLLWDVAAARALGVDPEVALRQHANESGERSKGRSERDREGARAADPRQPRQPDGRGGRGPALRRGGTRRRALGASTGEFEAVELRDGGDAWGARACRRPWPTSTASWRRGQGDRGGRPGGARPGPDRLRRHAQQGPAGRQRAILGVSLAAAKAAAPRPGVPLWRYVGGEAAHVLPVPMMNVLNGGSRGQQGRLPGVHDRARGGGLVRRRAAHRRGGLPRAQAHAARSRPVHRGGRRGRLRPDLDSNEAALEALVEGIEAAGHRPGEDVVIALDPATSEIFEGGSYVLEHEGRSSRTSS